jgi:hypothetical protein
MFSESCPFLSNGTPIAGPGKAASKYNFHTYVAYRQTLANQVLPDFLPDKKIGWATSTNYPA